MRFFTFLTVLSLFWACTPTNTTEQNQASTVNTVGYELETVPGTDLQKAVKRSGENIQEEGYLKNGKLEGAWITYHEGDKQIPHKITTYTDNQVNGMYTEMSNRGQLELVAQYRMGKLHGRYAKYRFGRLTEEHYYKDGLLDGVFRTFHNNSDQVAKEIEFKNGKEDGFYRYYGEDGALTLEYEYKNGEKVKGGIVEEGGTEEAQ